ncbi:PPPDE peptidase domain-containing protein [Purpureocillium lilacinum]|uniref:PPPDE peptidase domain-containing protein n=1 Tax=Purpureocillium lilacinum TaxID=33203 RepID=A0A179H7E5_PURLI|nr:PPPDE peptidase domain-containing protein [Purpureocillium lilacinum]OAQ85678.1 PPPDE peptidase domain-containing protein [Purpureocillium lilacinum]
MERTDSKKQGVGKVQEKSRKARADSKLNVKVNDSLAWPGRDKVDPRAPYYFKLELSEKFLSSEAYKSRDRNYKALKAELAAKRGTVGFYKTVADVPCRIPDNATFRRQAWLVGVAVNPWRAVSQRSSSVKERLAHWGVYIRPADDKDAPYRIFGMNFYKQYGDDLILEDVWGTPGKNGEGEWKKRVRRDEFQIMRDSRLCDVKMFFSLEEFVLYAQWVLKNWSTDVGYRDVEADNAPGYAYSLLAANCQNFSKRLIRKMREDLGWTSPKRLEHRFVLGDLEKEIRQGHIHDLKAADFMYANAKLKAALSMWAPFI